MKEEGIKFDSQSINQISRAGRGSLRDCLTITDQAIAFSDGNLTEQNVSEMLGTLPFDHVFSLLKSIIERNAQNLFKRLNEISQLSVDYQRLMDLILESLQYISFSHISKESLTEVSIDKEEIFSLSQSISAEQTQILYQIGLMAKRDMDLAPDLSSGFEMALLRMLAFTPSPQRSENKKKIIDTDKLGKDENDVKPQDVANQETTNKLGKDENDVKPQDVANQETTNKLGKDENDVKPQDVANQETTNKLGKDENDVKPQDVANQETTNHFGKLLDKENWNKIFKSLELDPGTKQLISHCSLLRVEDSTIYFSIPEDKLEILNGSHRERFQTCLNNFLNIEANIFF